MSTVPLISVIIPMYNAEKYIESCLDSLAAQTFKDFEVIVVDDCSTDRSVEIVDGISDKFNGRLHLLKREKNSGGAAIPRNVGMRFSHGKYIAFCDNDDMFTSSALADLYKIAEDTQADVLHAERFLSTNNAGSKLDQKSPLTIKSWEVGPFVTKPEFVPYDIGERIKLFTQMRLLWNVWNKFFRRDFITKNCLEFPNVKIIDDMMFCFYCFCLAEKYVRVPTIFNLYRVRKDSHSHNFPSVEDYFHQSINTIKEGTKILDDFMNGMDFFKQHTEYKHMAINFFVQSHLNQTIDVCSKTPPHVMESILHKEFAEELGSNAALMSYLFNQTNVQRFQLSQIQQKVTALQQQVEEIRKLLGK